MAKSIRCPYTGRAVTIEYDEDTKHPGFYARGAFDPSIPFLDVDSAVEALSRRMGRVTSAAGVASLKCAYTNTVIGLDYRDGLWYAVGEFVNPVSKRWESRELLEWFLGRCKGDRPTPAKVVVVGEREPEPENPNADMAQSTGIALDAAEKTVTGGFDK